MDALIVGHGSGIGCPAWHQYAALKMHQRQIRRKLGVRCHFFDTQLLDAAETIIRQRRQADIAIVMPPPGESPEAVAETFARLSDLSPRPYLVLLESSRRSCSRLFNALPFVDRFIKPLVLRDRSLYQAGFEGGYIVTDFLAHHLHYDTHGWCGGVEPDPGHMYKISTGWNFGVMPWYRRWLRINRLLARPLSRRRIDVSMRIGRANGAGRSDWRRHYRAVAVRRLRGLEDDCTLAGPDRVPLRRYAMELRDSRIVVSPFGSGETSLRDYEAICSGALLMKPDMSHVATSPDIYRPYETYVPVRWDLANLEQTCRYYLEHEAEAQRIVDTAQERLGDYFRFDRFVGDFDRTVLTPPTFAEANSLVA